MGLTGHLDKEQPRADHAAEETRHRGGNQPVQATSNTAMSTEIMNGSRVSAARELRLRRAASTSLLTESATNSRPVSAPATAARASPKPSHNAVVYPTEWPPRS